MTSQTIAPPESVILISNSKGKVKRVYRWYATPWEILRQLPEMTVAILQKAHLILTAAQRSTTRGAGGRHTDVPGVFFRHEHGTRSTCRPATSARRPPFPWRASSAWPARRCPSSARRSARRSGLRSCWHAGACNTMRAPSGEIWGLLTRSRQVPRRGRCGFSWTPQGVRTRAGSTTESTGRCWCGSADCTWS